MKLTNFIKYFLRFAFLNMLISFTTIYYFDRFVFLSDEHKYTIYLNLIEDRNRFYDFVPLGWISIDLLFFIIASIFLVILYSTKFYTYVNELDFSYQSRYLDDYFILYLMWNSYFFTTLYLFRVNGLYRSYLVAFTFIVPFFLLFFRNSEMISNLLGRSVSRENYISFNLDPDSNFRNLRVLAYRNEKMSIGLKKENLIETISENVNELNKIMNINLVVLNVKNSTFMNADLEEYLIKLNKKVLIISNSELKFFNNFIYRSLKLDKSYIYYFNNDIQYGSKYIIKRLLDISIALVLLILLFPVLIVIYLLVMINDGGPALISQNRVGLHGKNYKMFKFRTMYKNSHELREELVTENKKTGPLYKIEGDPRIIKNLQFMRDFSLDELPQLINVIKGEMSLVGPRPLFQEDSNHFDKNYMRRLNVLPGMTGLLQINERDTDDFDIWYKHDIQYIENWSIYLDLKILIKTFRAVLKRSNAGK